MSDKPIPEKDPATGRFLTGNIGGGRPKGSRNALSEAFVQALHDSFVEHGAETIETVRTEKPDQYLKVIASLVPKELTLNLNDAESMTDDELIQRIRELDAAIHPFLAGREGGAGEAGAGTVGAEQPARLH